MTGELIPYYAEMANIIKRLEELNKLDYPHKRSYYAQDGSFITEDVPEYLEEQSLIQRWRELHNYERALDSGYCRNHLLVSLRLDLIRPDPTNICDPALAAGIAVSIYENKSINLYNTGK